MGMLNHDCSHCGDLGSSPDWLLVLTSYPVVGVMVS